MGGGGDDLEAFVGVGDGVVNALGVGGGDEVVVGAVEDVDGDGEFGGGEVGADVGGIESDAEAGAEADEAGAGGGEGVGEDDAGREDDGGGEEEEAFDPAAHVGEARVGGGIVCFGGGDGRGQCSEVSIQRSVFREQKPELGDRTGRGEG